VGALAAWVLSGRVAIALAGGLGLGWLAATRRGGRRAAARRRFAAGLEEALESMVAALRAGRGLAQAVEDAAGHSAEPVRSALRDVVIAVRAGQPLPTALAGMARTWPIPEVAYLRACLDTHSVTGGDVTALLLNLGGVLRERRHLSRELGGKTGEARSTAVLLALLPPGLLLYIPWIDPGQLAPLLAAPFGVASAVYSGVSWLAGVLIIRKMLGDVEREIEEG
jgi:tight adherence protein B